jgi:hypothetical protein
MPELGTIAPGAAARMTTAIIFLAQVDRQHARSGSIPVTAGVVLNVVAELSVPQTVLNASEPGTGQGGERDRDRVPGGPQVHRDRGDRTGKT